MSQIGKGGNERVVVAAAVRFVAEEDAGFLEPGEGTRISWVRRFM